jgi:hypothetical protein
MNEYIKTSIDAYTSSLDLFEFKEDDSFCLCKLIDEEDIMRRNCQAIAILTTEDFDRVCTLKNLQNVITHIAEDGTFLGVLSYLSAVNLWFKHRHDFFSTSFLNLFNLDVSKTDMELPSGKTIDYYWFDDDKLLFLEFSVGVSMQRLVFQKGAKNNKKYFKDFEDMKGNKQGLYENVLLGATYRDDILGNINRVSKFLKLRVPDFKINDFLTLCGQINTLSTEFLNTHGSAVSYIFSSSKNMNLKLLKRGSDTIMKVKYLTGDTNYKALFSHFTDATLNKLVAAIPSLLNQCRSLPPKSKVCVNLMFDGRILLATPTKDQKSVRLNKFIDLLGNAPLENLFQIFYSKDKNGRVEPIAKERKTSYRFVLTNPIKNEIHLGNDLHDGAVSSGLKFIFANSLEQQAKVLTTIRNAPFDAQRADQHVISFVKYFMENDFSENVNKQLLCQQPVEDSLSSFKEKYFNKLQEEMKVLGSVPKAAFTHPFACVRGRCALDEFALPLLSGYEAFISKLNNGHYDTREEFVRSDNYNKILKQISSIKSSLSHYINDKGSKDRRILKGVKYALKNGLMDENIKVFQEDLNKHTLLLTQEQARCAKKRGLRLINSKHVKGVHDFDHMRRKIKGVVYHPARKGYPMNFTSEQKTTLYDLFSTFIDHMFEYSDEKLDIFNSTGYTGEDVEFLKELKTSYLEFYNAFRRVFDSTKLASAALFISRFFYSLSYLSSSTFKAKFVAVDNLTYKDTLLLVMGGKSIFSTKQSRFFRLIFPIEGPAEQFYSMNPDYKCEKGTILTPWMKLDEEIVSDGIFFYQKIMSHVIITSVRNFTELEIPINNENMINEFKKHAFPVLLSLNNRRQTEAQMHNNRYLRVNSDSDYSALTEMIDDLVVTPVCPLTAFINYKILDASDNLRSTRHYYLGHEIMTLTDETELIYCTYLCSKGHYNQTIEQEKNLNKVMKTYNKINSLFDRIPDNYASVSASTGLSLTELGHEEVAEKLYSSEVFYVKEYQHMVGFILDNFLRVNVGIEKLTAEWNKILEVAWTTIANSKGLRYEGDEFFGNKGYYVVSKTAYKEGFEVIAKILESEMSEFSKHKALSDLNNSYANKIESTDIDFCIFHQVDKVQRAGGREIYVMDMTTKLYQSVIEKYFAFLCECLPNEFISVPSNQRLNKFHSLLFSDDEIYDHESNATLDCRRWGPTKSVAAWIDSMAVMEHLPVSFSQHAVGFFDLMCTKRYYLSNHLIDKIKSQTQDLSAYTYDPVRKSYYFTNWQGFTMGIFNFASSFFHAGQQMYTQHLADAIYPNSIKYIFVAHSDDSAFKAFYKNSVAHTIPLKLHEISLRCGNSVLSVKKSCYCYSKNYLEFLSIFYKNKELQPLFVKFISEMVLKPSGCGYMDDMNEVYSKTSNLLSIGCTLSEAYYLGRVLADSISYFHGLTSIDNRLNMLPQLFGLPDPHPVMTVTCGTIADYLRLPDKELQLKVLSLVAEIDDHFTLPKLKHRDYNELSSKYKQFADSIEQTYPEEFLKSWTLKNYNMKHSSVMPAWYYAKMKESNFVESIMGFNTARRIQRHFKLHRKYLIRGNVLDVNTVYGAIVLMLNKQYIEEFEVKTDFYDIEIDEVTTLIKNLEFEHSEAFSIQSMFKGCKNLNKLQKHNLTYKPIVLHLQSSTPNLVLTSHASLLVSQHFEPKWSPLLLQNKSTESDFNNVVTFAKECSVDVSTAESMYNFVNKMTGANLKVFYGYAEVESSNRSLQKITDLIGFISTNSIHKSRLSIYLSDYADSAHKLSKRFQILNDNSLSTLLFIKKLLSNDERYLDLDLQIGDYKFRGKDFPNIASSIMIENKWIISPYIQFLKYNEMHKMFACKYYYVFLMNQVRLGENWLGRTKVHVCLPEGNVLLVVNNFTLEELTFDFDMISKTSFDFVIDFILEKLEVRNYLESCPLNFSQELAFGKTHSGAVGVFPKTELSLIIRNSYHNTNMDIPAYKLLFFKNNQIHANVEHDNKKRKVKINFFEIDTMYIINDLRKFIPNSENNRRLLPNMSILLSSILSKYQMKNATTEISYDLVSKRFLSTVTYKAIFSYMRGTSESFFASFIEYRDVDKDFGMIDLKNIPPNEWFKLGLAVNYFPSNVLSNFEKFYFDAYSDDQKALMLREFEPHVDEFLTKDVEDWSQNLKDVVGKWGSNASKQSINRIMMKDPRIMKTLHCYYLNDQYVGYFAESYIKLIRTFIEVSKEENWVFKDLEKEKIMPNEAPHAIAFNAQMLYSSNEKVNLATSQNLSLRNLKMFFDCLTAVKGLVEKKLESDRLLCQVPFDELKNLFCDFSAAFNFATNGLQYKGNSFKSEQKLLKAYLNLDYYDFTLPSTIEIDGEEYKIKQVKRTKNLVPLEIKGPVDDEDAMDEFYCSLSTLDEAELPEEYEYLDTDTIFVTEIKGCGGMEHRTLEHLINGQGRYFIVFSPMYRHECQNIKDCSIGVWGVSRSLLGQTLCYSRLPKKCDLLKRLKVRPLKQHELNEMNFLLNGSNNHTNGTFEFDADVANMNFHRDLEYLIGMDDKEDEKAEKDNKEDENVEDLDPILSDSKIPEVVKKAYKRFKAKNDKKTSNIFQVVSEMLSSNKINLDQYLDMNAVISENLGFKRVPQVIPRILNLKNDLSVNEIIYDARCVGELNAIHPNLLETLVKNNRKISAGRRKLMLKALSGARDPDINALHSFIRKVVINAPIGQMETHESKMWDELCDVVLSDESDQTDQLPMPRGTLEYEYRMLN